MRTAPSLAAVATGAWIAALTACHPAAPPADPATPAAVVHDVVSEEQLGNIELSEEAARRLGIETVPLERRAAARTRSFGGELTVPHAAGTAAGELSSLYALLAATNPAELARLADLQVQAEGAVEAARIALDAARIARARAEEVRRGRAGSERAVDEARAQERLAEASLRSARDRRELLGAPLSSAVAGDLLWVRVPVYAGELASLDAAADARVREIGAPPPVPARAAQPIATPVAGASGAGVVDLYYALANPDGALRPGLPVAVAIPVREPADALVVPWSAVVYDVHGDTWVYEELAPRRFLRRRVSVLSVTDDEAALASGPRPGVSIVRVGAAELLGLDLGFAR